MINPPLKSLRGLAYDLKSRGMYAALWIGGEVITQSEERKKTRGKRSHRFRSLDIYSDRQEIACSTSERMSLHGHEDRNASRALLGVQTRAA